MIAGAKQFFLAVFSLSTFGVLPVMAQQYQWTNLAGMPGGPGNKDGGPGVGRHVPLRAIANDASGNVYTLENMAVRKVTAAGVVSTITILPGGYTAPNGVAADNAGNVYVSDFNNRTIHKVTPAGVVMTFAGSPGEYGTADGTGSSARFWGPLAIAIDSQGILYVADSNAIRKITPSAEVTTLAGVPDIAGSVDGTGSAARFNWARGLAVDNDGNVYVADNNAIRKVTPAGIVTTLAGSLGNSGSVDGTGSAARFGLVYGVAVDASGNVYVADGSTIRKVTSSGVVTTLAGKAGMQDYVDGTGSAARFGWAAGVAFDGNGDICVADQTFAYIRKVTPSGVVSTWSGLAPNAGYLDGLGSAARFANPRGITVDGSGLVYVADAFSIRTVTSTAVVSTLVSPPPLPVPLPPLWALGSGPALASDSGGTLYLASSDHVIRKVVAGVVTVLAGSPGVSGTTDGTGNAARFNQPNGLAVDSDGNLYVADTGNHTIRKVTAAGIVTTLVGSPGNSGAMDGSGTNARFNNPYGIAVDRLGILYVADANNRMIRKVTVAGSVTTLAGLPWNWGHSDGQGFAASFAFPSSLAVDAEFNVYVTDTSSNTIRKVTQAGVVTTIGGTPGLIGGADGLGSNAEFASPFGITITSDGVLYVTDTGNNCIYAGLPIGPEIAVEQPPSVSLVSAVSTVSCGTFAVGNSSSKSITIRNKGNRPLTGLALSLDGTDATSYAIDNLAMSSELAAGGSTTFDIIFNPSGTASGTRRATLHIASNDANENPFYIALSGQIYSATLDTDGDGLNDWAEFLYAPLGFDWQVNQTSLVSILKSGANAAGHYTPTQVQAIHVGTPLLTKGATTNQFKLTLGIEKSTNLTDFTPFPLNAPQTTINGDGKIEFLFTAPENAAFVRVLGQ